MRTNASASLCCIGEQVRCRAECRGATALSSETVICSGFRDDWGRRLWEVTALYNSRYGFELFGETGQLQLTRYAKDQLYNWHMDLGAGAMSLRKISVVVELAAVGYDGGGIEIFYGEETGDRVVLGQGDALIFPSFIMHRALPVQSGTRWTLVSCLTGPKPLI